MSDDPLIPVFIPTLVSILANREQAKGSPLTRDEVIDLRDRGICVMLPQSKAIQLAEKRGYDDIDPEQAWEEWQVVRVTLSENQEPA